MLVWNDIFLAQHDSPWCIVEKAAWLSVKRPIDVVQCVAKGHVTASACAANHKNAYVDTQWLHVNRPRSRRLPSRTELHEGLVHAMDERCGTQQLGFVAHAMLSPRLKVCHTCLALGYHSIVHQIEGLRICPIHESLLSETCLHCNRSLRSFSAGGTSSPFACNGCGTSFLKEVLLQPPSEEIRDGEHNRIEPLIQWIKRASNSPIHWPSWSPEWRFRADVGKGYQLTTFPSSLPRCLDSLCRWPPADQYFGASAASLDLVLVEDGNQLRAWSDVTSRRAVNDANRASAEMKAFTTLVARLAQSDILERMTDHHSCLDDVITMMTSTPNGAEFEFSANPAICGVAQSFVIWQSRLQAYTHELALSARRGWSPVMGESLANILRIQMQSLFYYGANQVACLQANSTLTMGQRYTVIRTADCPNFAKPEKPFHDNEDIVDVQYIFQLKDEGVFRVLRCDRGRYRHNRLNDMNLLINKMVSSVHSGSIE